MTANRSQQRRTPTDAERDEALTDAVVRLTDELQVVSSTLEAIREELSWLIRNGIPPHADSQPCHGVLQRMARDPTSDEWGDRLHIERGAASREAADTGSSPESDHPTESHAPAKEVADESSTQSKGRLF